jgi:hypothetical protein
MMLGADQFGPRFTTSLWGQSPRQRLRRRPITASNCFAGPKEDVATATAKWGETLGQNDPDKVIELYAPDAVLWGTLSPTVRADRAALRDYFVGAFKVLPAE